MPPAARTAAVSSRVLAPSARVVTPYALAPQPWSLMPAASALLPAIVKPLVGNQAPDFSAEAVFDQEFINVTLSKHRGKCVLLPCTHPRRSAVLTPL